MSEPAGYVRRSRRTVYENPWIRFEAHEIVHPNGAPGEHGAVVTPVASAVVALDGETCLLARQPRFAIDRVVLEVVKGGAEPGEAPLACAQRELLEELGVRAARWDPLGIVFELPSLVQEPVHLFLARDLAAATAAPEAVESIDLVRLPFDEALRRAAEGEIDDALTGLALLRAARRLGRL